MAKYELPDYMKLYHEKCAEVGNLNRALDTYRMGCRDQIAMAALTGLIINNLGGIHTKEQDAKDAYEYADAMLAAREAPNA